MSGVQFLTTVVRCKDGGAWGRVDLRYSGSSPVTCIGSSGTAYRGFSAGVSRIYRTAFLSKNVWLEQLQDRTNGVLASFRGRNLHSAGVLIPRVVKAVMLI